MPKTRGSNTGKFWSVETSTGDSGKATGELWLYGIIAPESWFGDEITPKMFVDDLNALGDITELNVHIFSDGGDMFAGNAIYSTLKQRKEQVNVYIEGIAASMASVVAMAGDTVYIADTAMLMIHNPMVLLEGLYNKFDIAKFAEPLDRLRDVIVQAYTNKTGLPAEQVIALLDADDGDGTYLSAEEAIALGFCDAVTPDAKASLDAVALIGQDVYFCRGRKIDLSKYNNAPKLAVSIAGQNGGKANMPKVKATKSRKYKAELISTECPHCGSINELDTASTVVIEDPAEDATVAVPMEEVVDSREQKKLRAKTTKAQYRNEIWKITCPNCGGEYEVDTDPGGAVATDEGDEVGVGDAIPQARKGRKTGKSSVKIKNSRKPQVRGEDGDAGVPDDEPVAVTVTCDSCGADIPLDIDPLIDEAVVTCPNCGNEMTLDTGDVGSDTTTGVTEPPDDSDVVAAYRKGVINERQRQMGLDELATSFPAFAGAMSQFRANGSSVQCAKNWVLQALQSGQRSTGANPAHLKAARRDAAPLNRLGSVVAGNDRAVAAMENYNALAALRGTLKEVK